MSSLKCLIESQFKSCSFFNSEPFFVESFPSVPSHPCGNFIVVRPKGLKLKQLKLSNKYLILSKKVIDLENLYYEEAYNQKISEPGIRIFQGKNQLELFGQSPELIAALRQYSIQTNFTERFKILSKLGSGQTSQVLKVRCKTSKMEFACKFLPKNRFLSDPDRQALRNELSILRSIDHPNLVKLREVYETCSHIGLIFDCFEGGELPVSKYGEADILRIIRPLVDGLSYLHDQGIFHRDIKPNNILLRNKHSLDSVCLVDFGLADRWNEQSKYLFHRCGTPGYVAPEVLRDQKYTTQVDVYSLGILLYTLLVGQNPFDSPDENSIVVQNYYGQVDFWKIQASYLMMDLLRKMLNLDPEKRITPKQILQHMVFSGQEGFRPPGPKLFKVSHVKLPHSYLLGNIEPFHQSSINTLSSCGGSPTTSMSPSSNSSQASEDQKSPSQLIGKLKGLTTFRKSKFQMQRE